MTLAEIIEELKQVNQKIWEEFPIEDREKQVLARLAKLTEESGEFANELLSELKLQRATKLQAYNRQDLEKEWSDVFNALMLLGIELDLDLEKSIRKRLDEIHQRQNQT